MERGTLMEDEDENAILDIRVSFRPNIRPRTSPDWNPSRMEACVCWIMTKLVQMILILVTSIVLFILTPAFCIIFFILALFSF